ncbi:MAG: CDP-alcohol phosphatidyltransferase family protein [Ignavibacteria bacterium]|nr:CDP-alcohol phosphatidyltransferase family protein [Ignavibacteria bacterium]
MKEFFLISNIISLLRLVFIIPCVLFLWSDNYITALILIIIIWISDLLDGYLARKRNEISELGKIIDPIADKVSVAAIMLTLVLKGIVPLWFALLVIARDLLIISGGLYLKIRRDVVLQSDILGKLAVFVIGFTFFVYVFNIPAKNGDLGETLVKSFLTSELFIYILLFLSVVMIIASLTGYFRRFLKNK